MNVLDVGIDWFNKERGKQIVERVTITTASITRKVKASIIEPETNIDSQGVRVTTNKYVFLIDIVFLTDMTITRGIQFIRDSEPSVTYEAIIDAKSISDFNDPNNTVKAIGAQKRCS